MHGMVQWAAAALLGRSLSGVGLDQLAQRQLGRDRRRQGRQSGARQFERHHERRNPGRRPEFGFDDIPKWAKVIQDAHTKPAN